MPIVKAINEKSSKFDPNQHLNFRWHFLDTSKIDLLSFDSKACIFDFGCFYLKTKHRF